MSISEVQASAINETIFFLCTVQFSIPKRKGTLGPGITIVNFFGSVDARPGFLVLAFPFLPRFPFSLPACYLRHRRGISMSVNKVILVGRLGRDPETRYTGGGQAVANFSVATDESYKDKNGERQKRTEWHKIVVWGKQAEIAQQYLKKGSLIFIEGRIQSREWQDKEGQKRTSFEIVASNFRMLGGRSEGAAAAGASAGARSGGGADFESHTAPAEDSYGGSAPAGGGPEISDEDIPF
jgi:single-strand DNA-binding protein